MAFLLSSDRDGGQCESLLRAHKRVLGKVVPVRNALVFRETQTRGAARLRPYLVREARSSGWVPSEKRAAPSLGTTDRCGRRALDLPQTSEQGVRP